MFSCYFVFILPLILLKIQHESSAKNCSIVAWENVFETFFDFEIVFFIVYFTFFFLLFFSRLRLVFVFLLCTYNNLIS